MFIKSGAKKIGFVAVLAAVISMAGGGCNSSTSSSPTGAAHSTDAKKFVDSSTGRELSLVPAQPHANMQLFYVCGDDTMAKADYLTLQEALESKKLIVHETGNVNQLSVQNVSNEHIYIQAGDIVRGGRQDRMCPSDYVLAPKSGKVPVSSFCVEQSRWSARAGNSADKFDSSANCASSSELKFAARVDKDQQKVWQQVATLQENVGKNIDGKKAQDAASPTSLELTLSKEEVAKAIEDHVAKFAKLPADKGNILGYALVINGKIASVDVYGSSALFAKLWPKLLKSAAVEAVAKQTANSQFATMSADSVKDFMEQAAKGKQTSAELAGGNREQMMKSQDAVLINSSTNNSPAAGPAAEINKITRQQYLANEK